MQDYPRARQQARQLRQTITQLMTGNTSPPTLIATVADTWISTL